MARIARWMDLTELGDMASLTAAGWTDGGGAIDASTPYRDAANNGGLYDLAIGNNAFMVSPSLSTPVSTFYGKFHFRQNAFNSGVPMIRWMAGGNVLGGIVVSSSDPGILTLNNSLTTLASSTERLLLNTWYTVEFRITIGDSGTYEVRINGSSTGWIPSATGDTKPGADTAVDRFVLCESTGGKTYLYDDIAFDDAGYPGEGVITALHPSGAGATTELTPSSGANWQNVDEIPPSATDYNEATSPDLKDTYAHGALPGSAGLVKSAYVAARVVRIGTSIGSGYLIVRSGGTDYESGAVALPVAPEIVVAMHDEDPGTSAPWTVSGLNNSQIGIRFDS